MKRYIYLLTSIVAFLCGLGGSSAFAALSATISLVTPTVLINQPVNANVAIVNTGSAVNILSFRPTASATGNSAYSPIPAAFTVYNAGPNANTAIAANATTTIPFQVVFFAPSTGTANTSVNPFGTYSIGATINTSDGSVFSPGAAALVTVNPLPLPSTQQ